MFKKITSYVWLWAYGFTGVILFFSNLSINISNAAINVNKGLLTVMMANPSIFIAKLTGSQEIPFVNTDAMRTELFKENLFKKRYSRIQLNKVRKVTDWLSTYIHLKPYLSYPLFEKGFFY
jgi:hypothetical protein